MRRAVKPAPNWDRLFEFAVGQEGHFSTKRAAEAGYSPQLLLKYLKNGRVTRVRRGVYRIVHFPASEHEVSRPRRDGVHGEENDVSEEELERFARAIFS